jgi:maltooligosyltrehalose trehalohydrolase
MYRQDDVGLERMICLFNFSDEPAIYVPADDIECMEIVLDSAAKQWHTKASEDKGIFAALPAKGLLLPGCSVQVYRIVNFVKQ